MENQSKKQPLLQPELEFFTLLNPNFGHDERKEELEDKKEGRV